MSIKKAVAIGGALVVSSFAISAADASTPPGQTECPAGMVCVFNGTDHASGIAHGYYKLGPHDSNYTGKHLVVNAMWDKRTTGLWTQPDAKGTNVARISTKQHQAVVDFTTVKSINLQRSCPVKHCFTKIPQ